MDVTLLLSGQRQRSARPQVRQPVEALVPVSARAQAPLLE